ncbi:hypothetical protein [Burkholderia territorii]|uniref:hypothetical protein n=1 Tax=Burkholderia territorii TaxID=1503055 RepID=UPI0007B979C9|nr:hypothetical protein [Burkholderia territorii]
MGNETKKRESGACMKEECCGAKAGRYLLRSHCVAGGSPADFFVQIIARRAIRNFLFCALREHARRAQF